MTTSLNQPLPLEEWKKQLHENAKQSGRLKNVESITEVLLESFWREGCEPTIDSIIHACEKGISLRVA